MISLLVLILPTIAFFGSDVNGGPTREAGENIRIDVRLDFEDINRVNAEVSVLIDMIYVGDQILTADEIREANELDSNISVILDRELDNRSWNAVDSVMTGDEIELEDGHIDPESMLVNLDNAGEPIVYTTNATAEVSLENILPDRWSGDLDQERIDHVFSTLMLGGFSYRREIDVNASEGEVVRILVPTGFDPFGDGSVIIQMSAPLPTEEGYYLLEADGTGGNATSSTELSIYSDLVDGPSSMSYGGRVSLDWHGITTLSVQGDLEVESFDSDSWSGSEDLPPELTTPDTIPAAVVTSLYSEGLIDERDLESISQSASEEIEKEIEGVMEGLDADIFAEIDNSSFETSPTGSGSQLLERFDDGDLIMVDFRSDGDMKLNISEDYDDEQIMGLMNGGLSIMEDFNRIEKEDLEVTIKTPQGIIIQGEEVISSEGGRMVYSYTPGTKMISSSLAPEYTGEAVGLKGELDISDLRSHYIADAELELSADLEVSVDHLEFDPSSYDFDTDLDYSLDYVNSDLLRLLVDMEIVEWSDVEGEARATLKETLGDLAEIPDEDLEVSLIREGLEFDGDTESMTGDDPLVIDVSLTSEMEASDGLENNMVLGDSIVPIHLDPILPVYTVERSLDLGKAEGWDLDLKIRFPSGTGVSGWIGEGDDNKKKELETGEIDGYPVLYVRSENSTGDHIYMELQVGTFFAGNNVTICFGSVILLLLIIVLVVLLLTVRKIRKSKKSRDEEGEDVDEDEDENTGVEEDTDDEDWGDG